VLIPAGGFAMGSEHGQENERSIHQVWIDSFYLGECQVTNAEYAAFWMRLVETSRHFGMIRNSITPNSRLWPFHGTSR